MYLMVPFGTPKTKNSYTMGQFIVVKIDRTHYKLVFLNLLLYSFEVAEHLIF